MLKDFYKDNGIPESEWMPLEKDIVIVAPSKEYDVKPVLDRIGLSKYEVAVTWLKEGVDIFSEIEAVAPKLVLQADEMTCEGYDVVRSDEDVSQDVLDKVGAAVADAFVGLHHHDEFSIKDGLGTVDQLMKLLKAQRRSFCAVTNHGSVGGWIKQYNACRKAGIKAIFGMETYVSNYRGDDPEQKKLHRSANHLVLLARTKEGFDNIIRIHNDAQMNGFYYTPRSNHEAFKRWGKGVVASSACMAGEIPRLLMAGEKDKAKEVWEFYSSVFDRFYVELQIIESEDQRETNRRLIEFAREVGAPLLLTNDSHYLEPEHSETHDLLMCMRQGKTILDKIEDKEDVWNFDVKNLYYRNADQMWETFVSGYVDGAGVQRSPFLDEVFTQEVFLEAQANTRELAKEVEDTVLDSSIKLPKLYPDGKEVLKAKANEGLKRRWVKKVEREAKEAIEKGLPAKTSLERDEEFKRYAERMRHEFRVITKLGWTDYFLIMEKIISETVKRHGEWAVGYGRGSAAGSLISYCLGLTDVDPMKWGLMFERFLDEGRPDPPDIDTDFDPRIRDWVKKHIVETFGVDNVCSIGTYQTYRTRAVILDVARALGLDLGEASSVTKRIDPLRSFEDEDGEDTKVDKMEFDELCEHYEELKAYFETYPDVKRHAEILRNQVKNMGKHAGGVIISDLSLKDRIPVLYDKAQGDERQVISAWAESGNTSELSAVGLVKYDILGLNNLQVISDCVELVRKHHPSACDKVKRDNIPISDEMSIEQTIEDAVGIFQLENPSTKGVIREVRMKSLDDVAAVTSLIRPGPKDMDMHMMYARRKNGEPYDMPEFLRKILLDTYGVMTYQEQAMKISQELCGFTGPEANKLRKACGKKLKELMAEQREKFISRAQPRVDAGDISAEEVEQIWNNIESFAGYAFNKSHAICYSAISTVEMWLKANYRVEFMTALINNTKLGKKKHGSEDMLVDYVNYARRKDMVVVGPDVNRSKEEFIIDNGAIRFSIGHVKNVAGSAKTVVENAPYDGIRDFYDRVKTETEGESGKKTVRRVNKKVVESLIASGAFDWASGKKTTAEKRNELMAEYYRVRKEKEAPEEKSEEKWEELEKEMVGLCFSRQTLCEQYKEFLEQKRQEEKEKKGGRWRRLSDLDELKRVVAFGQVEKIIPTRSKSGNQRYDVFLTDGVDTIRFMVFTSAMQYFKDVCKSGYVVGVPLDRFDDGGNRFYDDKDTVKVVEKNRPLVSTVKPPRLLKEFLDGSRVLFDPEKGSFDEFYVYVERPDSCGTRLTEDRESFSMLKRMGDKYGNQTVYDDFVGIYKKTGREWKEEVSKEITEISKKYAPMETDVDVLFSALYAMMIAEENKINAPNKKRVKRLGVHQVLMEGMGAEEAADFSRGRTASWIGEECKKRGF